MDFAGAMARVYQYIWSYDACDVDQSRLRVRHYLQILLLVTRDIYKGMVSLRAMGLVYTTILSIVPLLAISLAILKGFGLREQLEPMLVSLLEPLGESRVMLASRIVAFVDNVKIAVLGVLGSSTLIFTVMSLIHKIESALNYTWGLHNSGSLTQRFINYLSVFLVVPVMMFTAAVITASTNSVILLDLIKGLAYLDSIIEIGQKLTPYALIIGAFIFVYMVVPNTRVRFRSALFGALMAGLLWKIVAVLFGWFIDYSTNYTAIYSGFAIVFLLIIWMYLGWIIVLTGSSFAYYHQYPQRLPWLRKDFDLSAGMRDQLACQLMVSIARSYDQSSTQETTVDHLSRQQRVPVEVVMRMIERLEADGLIRSTKDRPKRYLPVRGAETIRLADIIRSAGRAQDKQQHNSLYCDPAVVSLMKNIEAARESSLADRTLADLINDNPT